MNVNHWGCNQGNGFGIGIVLHVVAKQVHFMLLGTIHVRVYLTVSCYMYMLYV